MEPNFFTWPLVKLMTFTSAMNLIKSRKKNRLEPKIKRHDVYTCIKKQKLKFEKLFQREVPWEKQIYDYMDKFVEEGYFTVVDEVKVGRKKYQNLINTSKAEQLYEWIWISSNLTSKEEVGQIVREAIEDLEELNAHEKEKVVECSIDKIEEKRLAGFPFSISKDQTKKLLREAKKE